METLKFLKLYINNKYSRSSLARTQRDCQNVFEYRKFEPPRSRHFRERKKPILTRDSFTML